MGKMDEALEQDLLLRKKALAYRSLPSTREGLIDFCSNDYLGLARSSNQFQPAQPVFHGATGSRLISGNSALAESLEKELADFHRAEAALLFTSGYTANIGLLSCVASRGDTIIYDELAHASLRDGIRLSHARHFAFRHNDLAHLQEKLRQATGRVFIVVESLYSMDGDLAPLSELAVLAQAHDAALIVDEAHATGVYGAKGEGRVVALGLEEQVWARIHTFGKALGGHGAVVVGSKILTEYLINFARSFIYTTAMPDAQLEYIRHAYRLMQNSDRRYRLLENIQHFCVRLKMDFNDKVTLNKSPIQVLQVTGNEGVRLLSESLGQAGFWVKPILHPTVPKGRERIRICLHSFNDQKEIDSLLNKIIKIDDHVTTA